MPLRSAVNCGNWVVVHDPLFGRHVGVAFIDKSCSLPKLSSNRELSFTLVKEIADNICSHDVHLQLTDDNEKFFLVAARNDRWKVVRLRMSVQEEFKDTIDYVIVFLQTLGRRQNLRRSDKLSEEILFSVSSCLRLKKFVCHENVLRSLLTQTAARLNCWGLVRELLSDDFDLNTLDEEGMGVLHRLSMCTLMKHDDVLLLLIKKGANTNLKNIGKDTPLHVAAKYRNWRMMIALLRQGAKCDIANIENRTVLHILADCLSSATTLFQKHVNIIFTLIKKTSLDIDPIDCKGNTALHVAVRRGQSLIAEKLLTIGARADVVDADGRTVLHVMATEKHKYSSSLWERIVKCGTKSEIKDCEGNTALHLASSLENWHFLKMFADTFISKTDDNQIKFVVNDELHAAVKERHWNVVKWMIKYSSDINKPDSQGLTLLQSLALFKSDKSVDDIFSFLLNRGADIKVRTQEGENLLQLSVRHNNWLVAERLVRMGFGFCELDSEGRLGLLQRLIEQKAKQPTSLLILLCKHTANNKLRTPNGDTLLQLAAKHGNITVVKYLARKSRRETLNDLDCEGFSILHRLLQHQYKESRKRHSREQPLLSVVNILLRKGADPLSQCTNGDTILHLAAKHNLWDIVCHLVELGFDVNEADSEGLCILHKLVKSPEKDLRCFSCKPIENTSYRLLQILFRKGADPSIRTHSGDNVLHLAAREGNWTIVIRLLQQEKTVVNELDSEGFSILHRLVQDNVMKQKCSLLDTLINKGVDLNIISPHAGSALNMAVKAQEWSFARLLVERDADVDSKDHEGNTPLHITAKMNNWSFVAYLLKKGAHAKLPDSEGFTILHRCLSVGSNTCGKLHKDFHTAMDLILNSDVDVTIRDPEGNLAIHLAAINENMDLVLRLINTTVNLDLKDNKGFTLLMRASQLPSAKCKCVCKSLLDSGVDTEARSPEGMTAFEMAVQCSNWPAILALLPRCEVKIGNNVLLKGAKYFHELAKQKDVCEEHLRLFTKTLLGHGLDINETDRHGDSSLIRAAKHQNWNYVVVLLQNGAEANVNVDNQSFLHFILYENREIPRAKLTSLLDALQVRGVDFNNKDCNGRTILFKKNVCSSISYGQVPSCSLFGMLVDRGANLLVTDRDGHSLLRFALDSNEDCALNLVKFLVQAGVTTHQTTLTEAARTRTTFPALASLDYLLKSVSSPSQAAFEVENVQAFKLLIESGASSNRELFELSAQYGAEFLVKEKTRAKTEMLDILKQAASQPRSLKSLCRLTVSHALGCSTRRDERVTCLPVPQQLQHYILFRDILSEELQTPGEKIRFLSYHLQSRTRSLFNWNVFDNRETFVISFRDTRYLSSRVNKLSISFRDPFSVTTVTQASPTTSPVQERFCDRGGRAAKRSQQARAKQHVNNFVRVQGLSRPRRFLADRGVPPPHTLSRSPHQRKRVTKRKH